VFRAPGYVSRGDRPEVGHGQHRRRGGRDLCQVYWLELPASRPASRPRALARASWRHRRPGAIHPALRGSVDLSHPFNAQPISWPTATEFQLTKAAAGETEGGHFYAANDYAAAGTAARTSTRRSTSRAEATPRTNYR
jgi:hypothetical protein